MTRDVGDVCSVTSGPRVAASWMRGGRGYGISTPSTRGCMGCLRHRRTDVGGVCDVGARTAGMCAPSTRGCRDVCSVGADVWDSAPRARGCRDVCAVGARTPGVSVPSARGPSGMSDMAPSIRAPL